MDPQERHELMTDAERRYQTCIHEAGHVVIGYCFDAPLGERGCEVLAWDQGVTDYCEGDLTPEQEGIIVEGAGVAEELWLGWSGKMTESQFRRFYKVDWPNDYKPEMGITDSYERLELAKMAAPKNPYRAMSDWNVKVRHMLADPLTWAAVVTVANALYKKGGLEPEDIETLIMKTVRKAEARGTSNRTAQNAGLHNLSVTYAQIWRDRAHARYWEQPGALEKRLSSFQRTIRRQ
jgi:hypothetical protein